MHVSNLRSPERFRIAGAEQSDDYRGQCMRCGVCTIRCPTFEIVRDERDGPRGRVAMAIELLESDAPPKPETVYHLDRCLSCLACSNTCPFGVDHTGLWDASKARIEETHRRPLMERLQRTLLAKLLPKPGLFSLALKGAALGRLFKPVLPKQLARLVDMAPVRLPRRNGRQTGTFSAQGTKQWRVALLAGCAQQVLRPSIHESTVRFLTRHGCEIVVPPEASCCGALVLHMGRQNEAREYARKNIVAWEKLINEGGLDSIVINASGCGTAVKGYAELFSDDSEWAERATRISALTCDISELAGRLPVAASEKQSNNVPMMSVVYHNPCSLNNGQGIAMGPVQLLQQVGFTVLDAPKNPACCGSAGTYNMLQPELAAQLGERKAAALTSVKPDVIATGNIGCQVQVSSYTDVPVVHTIELLDWATGGPLPDGLSGRVSVPEPVGAKA